VSQHPRPLVSYVVPVFNEQESIAMFYDTLCSTISQREDLDFELVFIDDGSSDDSPALLAAFADEDPRVRTILLSRNFGHQAAVTAGMDAARGDAVVVMDADLQDPPAVSLELIKAWEDGAEIAYAQRVSRNDKASKRLAAHAYYRVLRRLSDVDIPADTGDFRLMDRRVVDEVNAMREPHRFLRGMVAFVGFNQVGVPFERDARYAGESKYPLRKMIQLAADGIISFSTVPLRLILATGYAFSGLAFIGIIYAVLMKFFAPEITVEGWTFMVISVLLMGGVQLIMLGIIGAYVGRIYTSSQGRPLYIARDGSSAPVRDA